jgi:hypothetical protein
MMLWPLHRHVSAKEWVLLKLPRFGGANHASGHNDRSRYGESIFQVHGVDAGGKVLIRRKLKPSGGLNLGVFLALELRSRVVRGLRLHEVDDSHLRSYCGRAARSLRYGST